MPFQWGPCNKIVAEAGMDVCGFCHEPAMFSLMEQSTQIRFMFAVPLAQMNSKLVRLCQRCKHGQIIPEAHRQQALIDAALLPDHATIERIWNEAEEAISSILEDDMRTNAVPALRATRIRLDAVYKPSAVAHVFRVYIQDLLAEYPELAPMFREKANPLSD